MTLLCLFALRSVRADLPAPSRLSEGPLPLLTVDGLPAPARLPLVRMPAEFERQQLLLLSCGDLAGAHADKLAEIAAAVREKVRVVVLCADKAQEIRVTTAMRRRMRTLENVTFFHVAHNTKWVRDYGPTALSAADGKSALVDWQYDPGRPDDDAIPGHLANWGTTPLRRAACFVEGGNLLSNGDGLVLTTSVVLDRNLQLDPETLRDSLRRQLGARRVVTLEPLVGEPTGHVDMFATFTSPDTVVVGHYDFDDDPVNGPILDRNAALLSTLEVPGGLMRVERVPMGARHDGVFRSYTNCVFANGVLLVPKYREHDGWRLGHCEMLFRRLLPGWTVVPIDASDLIQECGALHCVSLNIPALNGAPDKAPNPLAPLGRDGNGAVGNAAKGKVPPPREPDLEQLLR